MKAATIRSDPRIGYGLAIAAWLAAFGLRVVLNPWFPPGFPYLTFFPAVVVVAYYAGLKPAVLTAVLSGVTAWWFFIGPPGLEVTVATAVALGFYAFVVAVDIFFIVGMTTAGEKLQAEVARSAALAESHDLLSREVQHRVSNNIQVVSALLKLEAGMTTDAGARRVLSEAGARTALIARVQRDLADSAGKATAFADLALSLASDAVAAAGRTDDVIVAVRGGVVSLTAEEATPVMLTVLECVNNALEHGLPDRSGRIDITLTREGTDVRLEVADNGRGLSADFDPAQLTSLGVRIIHGMASQLGGRFQMQSAAPGVRCVLVYPAPG